MTTLNTKDTQLLAEAQQAVNLAVSPVRALASSENVLLAEIGLDLIKQLNLIDEKLTRLTKITD